MKEEFFDKKIKELADSCRQTPDPEVWDRIESALDRKRRMRLWRNAARFCAAADFDRDYPSFYQDEEIAAQMHYIRAFYKSHAPEELHYIYTTPEQIEAFVRRAPQIIGELLLREGYAI